MPDDLRHLHDRDFAAWAQGQADALRERQFGDLDCEILANELERMVSRERSEINQRLEALTVQLLLWTVHPGMRTGEFRTTIAEQRSLVGSMLRASPSLRATVESALARTYDGAVATVEQAGIPPGTFPDQPLFTLEQIIDPAFWPSELFGGRVFAF